MDEFLSFLGLAVKSGNVIFGSYACEAGIKNGKIKLLVVDGSASDNTKKKFADSCRFYNIEIVMLESSGLLGEKLGKPEKKVIGIASAGFAKAALKKYLTISGGE